MSSTRVTRPSFVMAGLPNSAECRLLTTYTSYNVCLSPENLMEHMVWHNNDISACVNFELHITIFYFNVNYPGLPSAITVPKNMPGSCSWISFTILDETHSTELYLQGSVLLGEMGFFHTYDILNVTVYIFLLLHSHLYLSVCFELVCFCL